MREAGREVVGELAGARLIEVRDAEPRDAHLGQGEGDGAPHAAGTHLKHRAPGEIVTLRARGRDAAAAVEHVADPAPLRPRPGGVDGTDQAAVGRQLIDQADSLEGFFAILDGDPDYDVREAELEGGY